MKDRVAVVPSLPKPRSPLLYLKESPESNGIPESKSTSPSKSKASRKAPQLRSLLKIRLHPTGALNRKQSKSGERGRTRTHAQIMNPPIRSVAPSITSCPCFLVLASSCTSTTCFLGWTALGRGRWRGQLYLKVIIKDLDWLGVLVGPDVSLIPFKGCAAGQNGLQKHMGTRHGPDQGQHLLHPALPPQP